MVQWLRWSGATLLAAVVLGLLPGCFGVSHSPSYFPHLLPFGDIIRTHAKPPGPSYFTNFDPHAVHLEVRPLEASNPVRTQHVLIATVYDEKGQPRRNRRVEWMLEGAGNIVEVDESGFFPGRGYKVDNHYAVSYTDYVEHRVSRNNGNPNDDFVIKPGQTWCVISSAVEGDSHITVYAPEIANWDHHKVFVTKHWVDAEWVLPKPAVNRFGTQHVFTTTIFRHSDHQPLANYRVRYRILDGPPAVFLPGRTREEVAVSDLSGNASVTIAQVAPAQGINRIGIDIIRPPEPCSPGGVGMVIAHGETTKEWQAPHISLSKIAPPMVGVGQEIPYTITVTNNGAVETKSLTVRDIMPEGLLYVRSDPPAAQEGSQLVWTLGELAPGQPRSLQAVCRCLHEGRVTNRATVVTEEGLKDEKEVTTQVAAPQLKLAKTGPATGTVGMPIVYQLTVSNPGSGPATNVALKDDFDEGLEHETKAKSVELPVGNLAAGESKTVQLTLVPRRAGTLVNRATATADGNLSDRAQHPVVVHEAKLSIKESGPAARYAGRPAVWDIRVTNSGEVPLTNVVVHDLLPPELSFVSATADGRLDGTQVTWNLGSLQPHEEKVLQLTTKCIKLTPRALNVATASADLGLQVQDEAPIEIRGLPAFRLEVVDVDDPVEVGGKTTYKIDVTNQGSLAGNQVAIAAIVPPEMKVMNATGPSAHQINGQQVTFAPVDSLAPQQTLSYTVEVEALRPGDVRFRTELRSTTLSTPVVEEESTNIIAPGGTRRTTRTTSSEPPILTPPLTPAPGTMTPPAPVSVPN